MSDHSKNFDIQIEDLTVKFQDINFDYARINNLTKIIAKKIYSILDSSNILPDGRNIRIPTLWIPPLYISEFMGDEEIANLISKSVFEAILRHVNN